MSDSEIQSALRTWIVDRAKDRPADMKDDTPVLETGILSSLDVVELILYVEHLKGGEVEVDDLNAESIRDVNAIYSTFFEA